MTTDERLSDIVAGRHSTLGVGSLPFTSPSRALDFVFSRPKIVPYWPELPALNPREGILPRSLRVASSDWEGYEKDEASCFFEIQSSLSMSDIKYPILKTHLLGPLSRAYLLHERLAEYKDSFGYALESALMQTARELEYQVGILGPLVGRLLVVLDEPSLHSWPHMEEQHRGAAADAMSYLYVRSAELGAFLGIHTCGVFQSDFLDFPLDLLSFDLLACDLKEISTKQFKWKDALRRGMLLVPGVFPAVLGSSESKENALIEGMSRLDSFLEIVDAKARKQEKAMSGFEAGVAFQLDLPSQILWSANCGHAGADPGWLESLYPLGELEESVRWTHS